MEILAEAIEKERASVYGKLNKVFGVKPPLPGLFIDQDPVALSDSATIAPDGTARVCSYYYEVERLIVIDPTAINHFVGIEKKASLTINPLQNGIRLLAKEYTQHCHAFVQEFGVMEQVNAHMQEIGSTFPNPKSALDVLQMYTAMTLPLARAEGIGYLGMLIAAKEFGHSDDYLKKYELDMQDRRETAKDIAMNGEEINESTVIQVASAFAHWLAKGWFEQSERSPKDIIHSHLTGITQDDLVAAMGYIIQE